MRQRAMIAMAIANSPSLLIADEPTTALDVTIQAQVLEVLKTVQDETHAATILITHDLGIVAELCDRVARHVRRAGSSSAATCTRSSRTRVTRTRSASWTACRSSTEDEEWLAADPRAAAERSSTGPPAARSIRAASCRRAALRCREDVPALRADGRRRHLAACHFAEELIGAKSKLRAVPAAAA